MKRVIVFALVLNAAVLGVLAHQMVAVAGGNQAVQNGDTNGDGSRDIGDAIYLLQWLFSGGAEPVAATCEQDLVARVAELEAQLAVARRPLRRPVGAPVKSPTATAPRSLRFSSAAPPATAARCPSFQEWRNVSGAIRMSRPRPGWTCMEMRCSSTATSWVFARRRSRT